MTAQLTPAQRLALSRAQLVSALRDPVWLILLERWLHSQAKSETHLPATQPAAPVATAPCQTGPCAKG
jgi:hypothetical protein